jgi:glycosyltransferase involved in cell wall biosynthesis
MDLPNISILIPTYNRKNFLPFVIRNLKVQDYPHKKLQVVIDDDGEEPLFDNYNLFKEAVKPIKVKYMRNEKKRSIGFKRHNLIKNSNNEIIAFMDDDDLYEPTYISHSYKILKEKKAGCVGCDKMIFLYHPYTDKDFYALNANSKLLIHEATIMLHKKWYNKTRGFMNSNRAEGLGITESCKEKTIALTNPFKTMTAIIHKKNTIDKDKFKGEDNNLAQMSIDKKTTDFIMAVCT